MLLNDDLAVLMLESVVAAFVVAAVFFVFVKVLVAGIFAFEVKAFDFTDNLFGDSGVDAEGGVFKD